MNLTLYSLSKAPLVIREVSYWIARDGEIIIGYMNGTRTANPWPKGYMGAADDGPPFRARSENAVMERSRASVGRDAGPRIPKAQPSPKEDYYKDGGAADRKTETDLDSKLRQADRRKRSGHKAKGGRFSV